MASKRQMA